MEEILNFEDLQDFGNSLAQYLSSNTNKKDLLMLRQFIEKSIKTQNIRGLVALDVAIETTLLEKDLQNLGQLMLDSFDGAFDEELLFGLINLLIAYRQEFKPNFIRKVVQKGLRLVLNQDFALHSISNYKKLLKEFPKATALETSSMIEILIGQSADSDTAVSILCLLDNISTTAQVFRKTCHSLIILNDLCTGEQHPLSDEAMRDRFTISLYQDIPESPAIKYFEEYKKYMSLLERIIIENTKDLDIGLILTVLACYLNGFLLKFAEDSQRFLWASWINKILVAVVQRRPMHIGNFGVEIGEIVEKSIRYSLEYKLKIRFENPQQGLISALQAGAVCAGEYYIANSTSTFVEKVLLEELQVCFEKYHEPGKESDRYDELLKSYLLNLCNVQRTLLTGKKLNLSDKFAELFLKFMIGQDLQIRRLIQIDHRDINNEHEIFESVTECLVNLFPISSPEMQKASASYLETIFSGIDYEMSWKLNNSIQSFFSSLERFAHPRLPAIRYLEMNSLNRNEYQNVIYVREESKVPAIQPITQHISVSPPQTLDTAVVDFQTPINDPPEPLNTSGFEQKSTLNVTVDEQTLAPVRFFKTSNIPEKRGRSDDAEEEEAPRKKEIKDPKEHANTVEILKTSVDEISQDSLSDDQLSIPDIVVGDSDSE